MTPCTAFAGFPQAFSDLLQEFDPADVAAPQGSAPQNGSSAHRNNGKEKNNDDDVGFGNRDRRGGDRGRGRTDTPMEQEPATD
jgi:hypothetical protein